ncbi:MAG: hypothetical protein PVI68_12200, partial [Anaerolineae bacterium]
THAPGICCLVVAVLLALVFCATSPLPGTAAPALVVDTTVDSPMLSDCTPADNDCSLRGAIIRAKTNANPDTITFDPSTNGTPIVLGGATNDNANVGGDLDISDAYDLTIQGNGADQTIVDGSSNDRVIHVCPYGGCSNTVTLIGLTIRNGSLSGMIGSGGGILNRSGTLNLHDCTLGGTGAGNHAVSGGGLANLAGATATITGSTLSANMATSGGGIYNGGTLILQNSALGGVGAGNSALTGGGLYNSSGTATLDGSRVEANTATYGAGIHNQATLTLQNGSIIGGPGAGNQATGVGGGLRSVAGVTTVDDSIISANTATKGGGVYNEATLIVQNGASIGEAGAGNVANEGGGGIYNYSGVTTVAGSVISANSALEGGGIFNSGTLTIQDGSIVGGAGAGNTAQWSGGGIHNLSVTTVDGSTVSANTAGSGGGIYNEVTLTIQNGSTIGGPGAGNTASHHGGGIFNFWGSTTVDASTVSANRATSGGGVLTQAGLVIQNGSTIGGFGAGNAAVNGGGIYVDSLPGSATISGSRILHNSASDQGGGLYTDTDVSGDTVVTGSCIVGNSATAFFNNQVAMQTASGNWWGVDSGPSGVGPGEGDSVSNHVDYSGFLTAPILDCYFYVYLPVALR